MAFTSGLNGIFGKALKSIGLALANKFLLEKPKKIILVDIKFNELKFVDKKLICKECDVTNEDSINALIDEVNREYGLIDIFCSNAGVLSLGNEQVSVNDWNKNWNLHVMSHVFAAKKLLPDMLKRGSG